MQNDDRLGQEVSVDVKVTESGVTARAKSRAVSGWDRLIGNLSELLNAPIELRNARTLGEKAMIEAAAGAVVDRINANPEVAGKFIAQYFPTENRRLANKKQAFFEALEDLSSHPPTDEQANSGAETLEPIFLDRWERYAEDAGTDELKAKWAKVLASEIRQPGRISRRTMRAVDELPAEVALQFEKFCRMRLDRQVFPFLTGELEFQERANFISYDLMLDPGFSGLYYRFSDQNFEGGTWLVRLGNRLIGLPKRKPLSPDKSNVIEWMGDVPALSTYVLTDIGFELASVFDSHLDDAWEALIKALVAEADAVGGYLIREYCIVGEGLELVAVHGHKTNP